MVTRHLTSLAELVYGVAAKQAELGAKQAELLSQEAKLAKSQDKLATGERRLQQTQAKNDAAFRKLQRLVYIVDTDLRNGINDVSLSLGIADRPAHQIFMQELASIEHHEYSLSAEEADLWKQSNLGDVFVKLRHNMEAMESKAGGVDSSQLKDLREAFAIAASTEALRRAKARASLDDPSMAHNLARLLVYTRLSPQQNGPAISALMIGLHLRLFSTESVPNEDVCAWIKSSHECFRSALDDESPTFVVGCNSWTHSVGLKSFTSKGEVPKLLIPLALALLGGWAKAKRCDLGVELERHGRSVRMRVVGGAGEIEARAAEKLSGSGEAVSGTNSKPGEWTPRELIKRAMDDWRYGMPLPLQQFKYCLWVVSSVYRIVESDEHSMIRPSGFDLEIEVDL